jgi:ABC-type methionine transport system ATPase subunit
MSGQDSMISIQHLSKCFGDNEVLKDVNIEIAKGEVVVVLGPSGSGKSTMLRCINLLEKPTGGHIFIEGKEITDPKTDVNKLREHVGMVFQQFNLFPQLTALKNVMLAQRKVLKRSKEEAERIAQFELDRVGLGDRADYFPAQLSGGQQQRVAIARALAMEPHVMLFDEATSALDPKTTRQILELIKDINAKLGITVVIITHQMSVVKEVCNHVAILDDGCVAEEGLVAAVFAAPKSAAGRRLVFPGGVDTMVSDPAAERRVRLIFRDSRTTGIPLVARLAAEENIFCNVISASTQKLSEEVYGSLLIGIPSAQYDRAIKFISTVANVTAQEVDGDVQ